jgi:hypothetical protein
MYGYRHRLGRAQRPSAPLGVQSLPPAPAAFVSVISAAGRRHIDGGARISSTSASPLVRPRGAGPGGRQAAGHRRRRANHPDLRTPAHPAVTEAHGQGRRRACQAGTSQTPGPAGQARPPSHGRPSSPAGGKDEPTMTTSLARRPETGGGSPQAVPAGPAAAGYLLPATERGTAARAAAAPGTLTGPWVACPRFSSCCRAGIPRRRPAGRLRGCWR